jgi:hypothetical protein
MFPHVKSFGTRFRFWFAKKLCPEIFEREDALFDTLLSFWERTDLLNPEQLICHQEFIIAQDVSKASIGKPGYSERKFWEELIEFEAELVASIEQEELTDNFINELGDMLFGVLGKQELAEELVERLAFNQYRSRLYLRLDQWEDIDSSNLKLTPEGWTHRDGTELSPDLAKRLATLG